MFEKKEKKSFIPKVYLDISVGKKIVQDSYWGPYQTFLATGHICSLVAM
jgi:hypothetical protein